MSDTDKDRDERREQKTLEQKRLAALEQQRLAALEQQRLAEQAPESILSPNDTIFSGDRILGQLPPIGSSRSLSNASSPAAMASSSAAIADEYEEDVVLPSSVPETIVPSIVSILAQYMPSRPSMSVSDAIQYLTAVGNDLVQRGRALGDSIIEETITRRKQQELQEIQNKIEKANNFLKAIEAKRETIQLGDVLRMIELEAIIENIVADIMPSGVDEIPPLLVIPFREILNNYENYFGWETQLTQPMIANAFAEFRNKLQLSNMIAEIDIPNTATLNDVIDELFGLYNRNFNTLEDTTGKTLSINGRTRVIKSIHTGSPFFEVTRMESKKRKGTMVPIISAVDYSTIWDNHTNRPKADIDREIAALRQDANADAIPPPERAILVGRNTRHFDIAANAGPAVEAAPVGMVVLEEPEEGDLVMSQPVSDWEGSPPEDYEVDMPINREARLQFLASQQINVFHQPIPIHVQELLTRFKEQRNREQPTRRQGEIAELSRRQMEISDTFTSLIMRLHQSFNNPDDVFGSMQDPRKTEVWNQEVERIFVQWYREYESIERRREQLYMNSSSAKERKGGIKSHKKQKKQQKKQTRKTGGKRSTRKLQKKNHKKRSGHTKKQ